MSGPDIVDAVQSVCWCIVGCNAIWAFAWTWVGVCEALMEGEK